MRVVPVDAVADHPLSIDLGAPTSGSAPVNGVAKVAVTPADTPLAAGEVCSVATRPRLR